MAEKIEDANGVRLPVEKPHSRARRVKGAWPILRGLSDSTARELSQLDCWDEEAACAALTCIEPVGIPFDDLSPEKRSDLRIVRAMRLRDLIRSAVSVGTLTTPLPREALLKWVSGKRLPNGDLYALPDNLSKYLGRPNDNFEIERNEAIKERDKALIQIDELRQNYIDQNSVSIDKLAGFIAVLVKKCYGHESNDLSKWSGGWRKELADDLGSEGFPLSDPTISKYVQMGLLMLEDPKSVAQNRMKKARERKRRT
jgi:hypothetical protein